MLSSSGIIRSIFFYKAYAVLFRDGKGIQAGSYLFDQPESALRVAYRTAYGIKHLEKARITVFEGMNSKEIAALLKKQIPLFDAVTFLNLARAREGYLFPETYFVDPDASPQDVVDMMTAQFDKEIAVYHDAFATSTRTFKDIVIMASIIEEEANNSADRRIISGILWKRIDKGMALQVDVPFYYITHIGVSGITLDDLATSSPYNTYMHKGLPPTPISSPGLDAIDAALHPVVSPYYFYLADHDGKTHYAKTFDGHLVNKQTYLQ